MYVVQGTKSWWETLVGTVEDIVVGQPYLTARGVHNDLVYVVNTAS